MASLEATQEMRGAAHGSRLRRRGVTAAAPPVDFSFDGRRIPALPGETIAAALAASGIAAIRQAEPAVRNNGPDWRGLYCGMGYCFDCVVTVDGRAGQRACLSKVAGGEDVRSTMPAGTPSDPLQPLTDPPRGSALTARSVDILVIGAGPAGLAAALAARRGGAEVLVLDERPQSGGQYYKPVAPSHQAAAAPDRQFGEGMRLLQSVRTVGVEILQGATVWGALTPSEVVTLVDGEARLYTPRRLILAAGAYERPVPIPGWTLPGVMTTGAAQTLARAYQVTPGDRVLVAGNGPLNFQLAADLATHGVNVVAVVESAALPRLPAVLRCIRADAAKMIEGANYVRQLKQKRVPILWSHAVVAAEGDGRLKRTRVARLSEDGHPAATDVRTIEADVLCVGYGFIAAGEAANALGCEMTFDQRHLGSLAVRTSANGETSIDGVFAVGDGASVAGAAVAEADGTIAGATAAMQLGFSEGAAARIRAAQQQRRRALRFQDELWSMFKAPPVRLEHTPDDTVLCRCESLDFGRIRTEIRRGTASLAVLKRRTRLGMGRCQGRYCTPVAVNMLRQHLPDSADIAAGYAPRLPLKPFPAGALAFEKPEWGGHQRAGSPDLSRPVPQPNFGTEQTDVAVIGGGVVGACLAYELALAGVDVLVIERDDANLQASGGNAGSLHVQLLSFDFGGKAEMGGGPAAATLPLGPWAVAIWQELSQACGSDFEIRITGGLMVAESESGMDFLRRKAALECSYGLEAEILGKTELRDLAPNLADTLIGAEYSPLEGKINPLTATYAVLEQAQQKGARYRRSTDVIQLERTGSNWRIQTNRGVIEAGRVVNAAGPWARSVGALAGVDVPVYSAPLQMIVTERAPVLVDQLVAHADRHLSLKQLASGGIVIGGAWTARYSQQQNLNVTIRESIEGNLWIANRVLPQLAGLHVLRTWAGMNVNIDGAPIVGEAPGARGFFNAVTSNGYTLAPAVARLTAQLICHGETEMDIGPYLLERFHGRAA